jgi:two-component system nitrogen regulation response regulator NtrX
VDVRVIAATNKNLEDAIQRGEFREDLFFRLNVIPILVPPLRERREDLPALVQHFARLIGDEHNMKPKRFDAAGHGCADALPLARQHPRAAQHHRAADDHERPPTSSTSRICRRKIRAASRARAGRRAGPAPPRRRRGAARRSRGAGTLREFKDAAERAYLVQKLRENNWNISKTAEVIDTPRSNLYKKLEQYGIKQELDG